MKYLECSFRFPIALVKFAVNEDSVNELLDLNKQFLIIRAVVGGVV